MFNGVEALARWEQPSWLLERPAEQHIGRLLVTSDLAGRPDKISAQIYGTSLLDWVLIAFNQVTNPFGWPTTGTVVEFPVESIVLGELL